jgi:hypothetical protein
MEDIVKGRLNRERLASNLQRIRSNVQTIRETMAETFSDRPVIGRLRKLRQTLRGEASTHPEYESTVEYDEEKTFKTQDGKTIRVFYLNGRPVHIEEVAEAPSTPGVIGEPSIVTIPKERVEVEAPLPPKLIERKPPSIKLLEKPRIIGSLREYANLMTKEKQLELEYQQTRLEYYRRMLQNPPSKTKQAEEEKRGGSHY